MFPDHSRGRRYNPPAPRGGYNRGRGGGFANSQPVYDEGYDTNPPFNPNYQQWNRGGYRGGNQRRDESSNYRFGRGGYRGRSDNQYQGRHGRYQSNRYDYQQQGRGGGNYQYRGGRNQGRYPRQRGHHRPPQSTGRFGRQNQSYMDPPVTTQSGFELPVGLSWHCDLSGHSSSVTCVAFGDEPGKLFSGGADGVVRQWNPDTGSVEHTATYDGEISAMLVTGSYLCVAVHCKEAGSTNPVQGLGDVHIYNLSRNSEQKFMAHLGRVTALHGANDTLFTTGEDKVIKAWKFNQETNLFDSAGSFGPDQGGHQAAVTCVASYCDFLFTGDIRGMIKVWDLQTGSLIQTLAQGHKASITSMLLYQGSLITGSQDHSISVWSLHVDRNTPNVIGVPPSYHTEARGSNGYASNVISLLITSDASKNDLLLAGLSSGEVLIYNLPTFALRGKIREVQEPKALSSIPSYCIFIGQRTGELKIYSWDDHNSFSDEGAMEL
eukprot:g6569.t1